MELLQQDFQGCYIVQNGPNSIKIGMSKEVLQRLKDYQGYQKDAAVVQVLCVMHISNNLYKEFEKHLHFCAEFMGLTKPSPKHEHFNGSRDKIQQFIELLELYCAQKSLFMHIPNNFRVTPKICVQIEQIKRYVLFKSARKLIIEDFQYNYLIDMQTGRTQLISNQFIAFDEQSKQIYTKSKTIDGECAVQCTDHTYNWQFEQNSSDKLALFGDLQKKQVNSSDLLSSVEYRGILLNGNELNKQGIYQPIFEDSNIDVQGFFKPIDSDKYVYCIILNFGELSFAKVKFD